MMRCGSCHGSTGLKMIIVSTPSAAVDWISIFGTGITAVGIFYAAWQFKLSQRLAKHQFVLELYDKMDAHNAVHEILTITDAGNPNWPESRKDWIAVGRLLGLFEHIGGLVKDRIMSIEQVDESFSYRLVPLFANEKIRTFVYEKSEAWDQLIWLLNKLEGRPVFEKLRQTGVT